MSSAEQPPWAAKAVPAEAVSTMSRLGRLARKELKETLRDRRTILTLVLMPVLVYPLLSVLFQRFVLTQPGAARKETLHLGTTSREQAQALSYLLSLGEGRLSEWAVSREEASEPRSALVEYSFTEQLDEAVARLDVDLGVRLAGALEDLQHGGGSGVRIELIQQRSSRAAAEAVQFVEARLLAARVKMLEQAALANGHPAPDDLRLSTREVAPADGTTAFSLASLVPLILVLMTITGAVYPAIDLTAGERERGTLEALVAAPVPRISLLLAKYVAVVTVAMLTAAVNLAAMTTTIVAVGLGPMLFGKGGLSIGLAAQVFALLALFAAFFSAALLAITSFARSFKEAQAYLIPVMMLSMAPGMASLLPGMRLSAAYAVTPLLNIVLLARDLCEQQPVSAVVVLAIVLSTALYAAAALAIAARIFGSDAILYGSQGSWSDLLRRPETPAEAPTMATSLFVLAVLFPVYFLASQFLGRSGELPIVERLKASAGLTALLFAGFPVAACQIRSIQFRSTFRWRPFPIRAFLGAMLLGVSLWAIDFEVVILAGELTDSGLNEAIRTHAAEMIDQWRNVSPYAIVAALALVPAVCEELFFRGFLLSGLRTRLRPWPAIVVSGMLFGAFHLITSGALSVVRFLPSSLMGVVLGAICLRSGSLFPGIALHAVHNGLLVLLAYFSPELKARGWDMEGATHLPAVGIAAAALVSAVGFALVFGGSSKLEAKNRLWT